MLLFFVPPLLIHPQIAQFYAEGTSVGILRGGGGVRDGGREQQFRGSSSRTKQGSPHLGHQHCVDLFI